MILSVVCAYVGFGSVLLGISKGRVFKRDGMEVDEQRYQDQDVASLGYWVCLFGLFVARMEIGGSEIMGTKRNIEQYMIILCTSWYSFDMAVKYFTGLIDSYLVAHHSFTIFSMMACYTNENTVSFGATALMLNDICLLFFVAKRTMERNKIGAQEKLFQINFTCLTFTFFMSRVIGNFWLIFKYSLSSGSNPLLVVLNSPILSLGVTTSIKLVSKFWKYLPEWASDSKKIEQSMWWTYPRKLFQEYKTNGSFTETMNRLIYAISAVPVILSAYNYFVM
ncbi:unnamed protein product [Moneuplotes crassus]|uniref:TLC domain-containing protein n=1 Tax=Euplotes crassus TaxID=5936 RepID=A0AAD2D006_EUPCR|nr:unnamed protein product [Moneuplotes crassus]